MKENTENNNNPALEELLQVLNQEVINSLLNGQYQITEVRDLVNTGGKWDYVYYICLHRKINLSIVLPGNRDRYPVNQLTLYNSGPDFLDLKHLPFGIVKQILEKLEEKGSEYDIKELDKKIKKLEQQKLELISKNGKN